MLGWLSRLLGPIFAKEAVEIARRRRYYLVRVLFGIAMLWALGAIASGWYWRTDDVMLMEDMSRMAHEFFVAAAIVQYCAVGLLPFLLCGVIASEREAGTLDLLLTTHLKDRDIVFGKLTSRVAVVLLLNLCGLSIISIATLLGGIDPAAILRVECSTLLAMFVVGSMSIYFSASTRTPVGALIRTLFWLAIWLMAWPMMLGLIGQYSAPSRNSVIVAWAMTHPIISFAAGMEPFLYREFAQRTGPWFFPLTFVMPTLLGLLLLWRGVKRVRVAPSRRRLSSWFVKLWKNLRPAKDKTAKHRARPWWRWPQRESANPLVLRAQRARVYDAEGYLRRVQIAGWLIAIMFLVFIALIDPRELTHRDAVAAFLAPTWITIGVVTVLVAGGSLVGDRRRGFLDQMLVTPLDAREIVDGTYRAVWRHVRSLYLLAYGLTLLFWFLGAAAPQACLVSIASGTLFGWVILMFGVCCSSVAQNFATAIVPTLAFPLVAMIGPAILEEMMYSWGIAPLWITLVLAAVASFFARRKTHPLAVATIMTTVYLLLMAVALCWVPGRGAGIYRPNFFPLYINPAMWIIGAFDFWRMHPFSYRPHGQEPGLAAMCYLGAVTIFLVAIWWWTVRQFDGWVGRESGKRSKPSLLQQGRLT